MRKLVNMLWLLPIFACGLGAGFALSGLEGLYMPMWWDYAVLGGVAGLLLILAIWWANKIIC